MVGTLQVCIAQGQGGVGDVSYQIKKRKGLRVRSKRADGEMTEWMWQTEEEEERDKATATKRTSISEALKNTLYQEQANWFLWLPVGLALGCAAYFSLLIEPSWVLVSCLLIISIIYSYLVRKHTLALAFSIFTLSIVSGFALSKVNTERMAAPVIQKRIGPVIVQGRIENVFNHANGETRIIINPTNIDRLKSQNLPSRIRIKLRKNQNRITYLPGQFIEAKALIFPPPEPTHPGGFDFARKSWFEGVGGSGFFIGTPKVVNVSSEASLYLRAAASLARFRIEISNRLKSQMGAETGGIAAALIVGDRAAISKDRLETLRDAGLAHLLAISGLHMVLFTGTIFWLLRALLALNATVLLRWPVKKWAAGGALVGAVYYLLLSGATIATQRAFIMIMIMFLAIMLDRPAITLRNIAIAALIILIFKPVSLLSVSFQMSFAATTTLVAFYEGYRRIEILRFYPSFSPFMRGVYMIVIYVGGIALTTLIAGLATSPFAAYYFHRVAVYSLLTNVLALPIVGLIVMPAGLVALFLMPLGLDGYVLPIMGAGIDMVIMIAQWTSSLPNAVQITPAFSGYTMLFVVIGALWVCLWRTRLRLLGFAIMGLGAAVAPIFSLPHIYVAASAKNIAVRGADGMLVVAHSREKYAVEKWLIRDGDETKPKDAARRKGFKCDAHGCIIKLDNEKVLGFSKDMMAVEEDCARVDILISSVPIRHKCNRPMVTIDKFDLWRNGAYSIGITGNNIIVRNVQEERGDRPWVRKRVKYKRYETKRKSKQR